MTALHFLARLTAFSVTCILGACGDSAAAPPNTASEATISPAASGRTRIDSVPIAAWERFYTGILLLYPNDPVPRELEQALSSPEFIGAPLPAYDEYRRRRTSSANEVDPLDGINMLESSSADGCAAATLALALTYLADPWNLWDEETQRARYVELLTRASEQGSATATGLLGLHTVAGDLEVERDVRAGRELLLIAHEGGDYLATHNLGACYYDGSFGTPNRQRAIEYYEEAGRRGNAKSYWALGEVFDPDDIPRSIAAFEQAARMGHDRAAYCFAERLAEFYPLEFQDRRRAERILRELVDAQSSQTGDAALFLASMEKDEDGDARLAWLRVAADLGLADAHYKIGWIYLRRGCAARYGDPNPEQWVYRELPPSFAQPAFDSFQSAATLGDRWAMYSMASLMVSGQVRGYEFSQRWLSAHLAPDRNVHSIGLPEDVAIVNEAAGWICRARAAAAGSDDTALVRNCDRWLSNWGMRCR